LLGITFLIVGLRLIKKLRQHHSQFYYVHKGELWAATLFLALPLTFRAVFDILSLTSLIKSVLNSPAKETTYNMIFFLFVDFLPIISQTSSLIFGLMRHR